jgi:hypothetical protein
MRFHPGGLELKVKNIKRLGGFVNPKEWVELSINAYSTV